MKTTDGIGGNPSFLDRNALQSYLYFGASYGDIAAHGGGLLNDCDTASVQAWAERASESALVKEGVRRLLQAVQASLAGADTPTQAVLLSGGYDSRAVFGALRSLLQASEITTLTLGTPGSLDFEIPSRLARFAGVASERLDATKVLWDMRRLVDYARSAHTQLPIPMADAKYLSFLLRSLVGPDATFWTGFLGGVLAGKRLPARPSSTWEEAVSNFLRSNRAARSVELFEPSWNVGGIFPDGSVVAPNLVGFDDQIEIAGRQSFRIGHPPWRLFREAHPYARTEFKSYMLGLPWRHRAEQPIYPRILEAAFPKMFEFPIQGNYGLGVNAPGFRVGIAKVRRRLLKLAGRPRLDDIQQLDYANALRTKTSYAAFATQAVKDLEARAIVPYVDLMRLWREHIEGVVDHSYALRVLSSLELNLHAMGDQ